MSWQILNLDCVDAMQLFIADNSIDAIVTDPPYGMSFMGKKWDYDVPSVAMWREAFRVLKPGGHLLSFAGTRTQHRMACAIEDAGFEIRDLIAWVYGSGFPKSLDVSKAIDKAAGSQREVIGSGRWNHVKGSNAAQTDCLIRPGGKHEETAPATEAAKRWQGWGTALKPALEPITVARKPLVGRTVAENVLGLGTGALNIDACRVETTDNLNGGAYAEHGDRTTLSGDERAGAAAGMFQPGKTATKEFLQPAGRWPANLIHDGSEEVLEAFPSAPGQLAEASSSEARKTQNAYGAMKRGSQAGTPRAELEKSAARFFTNCDVEDSEWLALNLRLFGALTAPQSLCLQEVADAIAQSDAVISALPEGIRLNALRVPSTHATASESKQLAVSVTEAIANIAPRFLREWRQEKLSPNESHVKVVATREPTGTMTITASHWKSDGSAEPVTFSITPLNEEVGEAVSRFKYCAKTSKSERGEGNNHPTVKPIALMRYLCRLVTPTGGLILDPFTGSGSTGLAALAEGFRFLGCEREAEYVAIAETRLRSTAVNE